MEVRWHTDRVTSGCGRAAGRTDLDELSDLCWTQPQPHAPQRVPELAVVEATAPIGDIGDIGGGIVWPGRTGSGKSAGPACQKAPHLPDA